MNQHFLKPLFDSTFLSSDEFNFIGNNKSCKKAQEYLEKCITQGEPATVPGPGSKINWSGLEADCPNCILVARNKPLGQIKTISFHCGSGGAAIVAMYGKIYAR